MNQSNKKITLSNLGYSKEQIDFLLNSAKSNEINKTTFIGYIGSLPVSKEFQNLLKNNNS